MTGESAVGAREYHERTNHSPESVRRGGRRLDFDTKPTPYKIYEDRPTRPLARSIRPPQQPALSAVTESTPDGRGGRRPDRDALGALCYYAAGITKVIERGNRTVRFRAASTTGALYHVDPYIVCADLGGDPDLPAGVYHFDPRTLSLSVLREGDHRGVLAAASGDEGVATAPISVVATSTWWRNAWKSVKSRGVTNRISGGKSGLPHGRRSPPVRPTRRGQQKGPSVPSRPPRTPDTSVHFRRGEKEVRRLTNRDGSPLPRVG